MAEAAEATPQKLVSKRRDRVNEWDYSDDVKLNFSHYVSTECLLNEWDSIFGRNTKCVRENRAEKNWLIGE